jgi:hypothetical protein
MRSLPAALFALTMPSIAFGQAYLTSTFAGGALPVNVLVTSTSIGPFEPQYIAADRAGNVYFPYRNTILRLDATTNVLTQAAGNNIQGFSGDNGPAVSAQLYAPSAVAVDSAGNLYIADSGNQRIREVSNGVIYTVAGSGVQGFSGDNGPATAAAMSGPVGVAVDSARNLYISDSGNERIRKVSNGVISTVAGNGTEGSGGDNGPAANAQFVLPQSIALDPFGNLYIVDTSQRIRRVSSGIITTVAGSGAYGYSGDKWPGHKRAAFQSSRRDCGLRGQPLHRRRRQ